MSNFREHRSAWAEAIGDKGVVRFDIQEHRSWGRPFGTNDDDQKATIFMGGGEFALNREEARKLCWALEDFVDRCDGVTEEMDDPTPPKEEK